MSNLTKTKFLSNPEPLGSRCSVELATVSMDSESREEPNNRNKVDFYPEIEVVGIQLQL